MSEILVPLTSEYTLVIPESTSALVLWVVGLVVIAILGFYWRDRSFKLDRSTLVWFAVLSVLILILTPFVGVLPRLSPDLGMGEVPVKHLMFFAAIPWMVAGGVLGVLPAILLGGISGLLLAYLDTHNIFTPLVMMSIAFVFSWCIRQRYRTTIFKWLRFPILAAAFSLLATAPLVFVVLVLSAPGPIAARVGVAIIRFPVVMFSLGGMVLIGGTVGVIVEALAQRRWGVNTPLQPAPGEVQFRMRLFGFAVPIFLLVLAGVLIGTWSMGQNYARRLISKQLAGTTGVAAESLGVFLDMGDDLMLELATEPQLISATPDQAITLLNQTYGASSFFDGLALFDVEGYLIAGVPQDTAGETRLPLDMVEPTFFSDQKNAHVFLATDEDEQQVNRVIFAVGVGDQTGEVQRTLWGQTIIDQNRIAQPFISAMNAIAEQGSEAFVVSNDGTLLYPRPGDENPPTFNLGNFSTATYFQSTSTDGRSAAHFYQPVEGTDWGIVATLPTLVIQEMAWKMTRDTLLIATGVMVLILFGTWLGLWPIVKEMETMTGAINAVIGGDFDFDHIETGISGHRGYFNAAFKKMVTLQKNRMERQEDLLTLSGKVAGQLNLGDSLHMILSAALLDGVCAARIFLAKTDFHEPNQESEQRFGVGPQARNLASLDQDAANLARAGGLRVLPGDAIGQELRTVAEVPAIGSMVIVPLKWRDLHLGVFWVAFSENLTPDSEVVQYLNELAQIASMAIVNAKTYQDSQFSSAIMETIFDLLPDALLIVDQKGCVLSHNVIAQQVFGPNDGMLAGKSLSSIFSIEDLHNLGLGVGKKTKTKEIHLNDFRAFNLVSSPIQMSSHQTATMMIFKDLTQQKKLDSLKTELVTTVSHELRSPLTLILGYAKILRLTGNLNEQQDVYISKIIGGVEEMKGLVQKLLDLDRLEGGDPLDISQFTVEEITHRVVESLEAQAKQKNIQLTLDLPGAPLLIEGDQTFLTQALKNLLENAIKFSKMGSEVKIYAREEDRRVIFAFQDRGIGIAPLDQRNLFKKFSRLSAQSGMENGGSGLGLAIVKSIAERHGGAVKLESQLGKGSTFYFEIPLRQDQQRI